MRELCIRIGGHLTSGGLDLGNHTTSGVIDLLNFLSRLYSGLEAAVVVDASSGSCLLRKSCVLESTVEPEVPAIRALLYACVCAENGCVPSICAVETAALRAFGSMGTGVVPDASLRGRLSCPSSGAGGILVFADPVKPFIIRPLGGMFSGTAVGAENTGASLGKRTSAWSGLCPASDAQAALEKSGRGECGVEAAASASGCVGRYRKLCEADPMTLGEMDNMTLDEMDFIYAG